MIWDFIPILTPHAKIVSNLVGTSIVTDNLFLYLMEAYMTTSKEHSNKPIISIVIQCKTFRIYNCIALPH